MTWHDRISASKGVELGAGWPESKIEEIEVGLRRRLPADYREALAKVTTIDGFAYDVDLSGESFDFEMPEILPHALPIAADGAGNYWVVDIRACPEAEATVFYVCHDAPVLLFQCRGVAVFMEELLKLGQPGAESLLDAVSEDEPFDVYCKHPGVLSHGDALTSDSELAAFAESLAPHFSFVDLREVPPGMGFSWGRFGPSTVLRRHGDQRIFAYAHPEKKPGILGRLLRR